MGCQCPNYASPRIDSRFRQMCPHLTCDVRIDGSEPQSALLGYFKHVLRQFHILIFHESLHLHPSYDHTTVDTPETLIWLSTCGSLELGFLIPVCSYACLTAMHLSRAQSLTSLNDKTLSSSSSLPPSPPPPPPSPRPPPFPPSPLKLIEEPENKPDFPSDPD